MVKYFLRIAIIVLVGTLIMVPGYGQAQPSSEKSADGFLKADKDGFIRSTDAAPVKAQPAPAVTAPQPTKPAAAPQPAKPVVAAPQPTKPAAATPQASAPVKQAKPAAAKSANGFLKADKDGFIRSTGAAPVKAEPAPAAAAPQPTKPAAATPQASAPVKQAKPAAAKAAEPVKTSETLPEAIQQVLLIHPEIKAASHVKQARGQEVVQARGAYYPTLDASQSWGYLQQDKPTITNNKVWPNQSTVSLRQNLFRGGATWNEVERQQLRVKSQAYLLQGTSENIALLTAKVYMAVLRAQELHENAKENLVNHERIADQVKLRMQSGVDRRADLDQVTGRLALAKSNVVVTAANLVDARTDYLAVVNRLPIGLVVPQPLDKPIPASMEEAEQLALINYPIVKSAVADLEARKVQYEVAKRLLSPSLDIAADYNWQDDVSPNLYKRDFWAASAVVSFNVFNGMRNFGRIKETLYLINEAEEILNNTKRQTAQSIRLSWEAYKAAKERVIYLEEYVKSTEATAAAFVAQWNIGRRTMFDLLDTQAEYINAKSDLVRAKYDKLYAEYRILSGMGKLVHTLGLKWPEESRIDEGIWVAPVKQAEPAAAKSANGFLKADKDGFIRSTGAAPVKAEPAPAAAAPQPAKPAVAAPQASAPVKQAAPASNITSNGFMKADKDGFIKSR